MKIMNIAKVSAALVLAFFVSTGSAQAGHNDSVGIYIGPDSFGLHISGGKHKYHKGHGHHKSHGHYRRHKHYKHRGRYKSGHWYKNKRYRHGHKYGHGHHYKSHKSRHGHGYKHGHGYRKAGGYGCHPVYKYGYHHGYKAKIGGTMCYDGYGNGYVVPGSRYVVETYGY